MWEGFYFFVSRISRGEEYGRALCMEGYSIVVVDFNTHLSIGIEFVRVVMNNNSIVS